MVSTVLDSIASASTVGASLVFGSRRIRTFVGNPPPGAMSDLAEFVDDHGVRGVVRSIHPLTQVARAHEASTTRGASGKIVIVTT